MILELASAQRRALRAQAHGLKPVVMIGDAGLSARVLGEINKSLDSHELIKIRLLADARAARARLLDEICATLNAAPVQLIGKILVVYRPLPVEVKARQSKTAAGHKPARRTKRSYQR